MGKEEDNRRAIDMLGAASLLVLGPPGRKILPRVREESYFDPVGVKILTRFLKG